MFDATYLDEKISDLVNRLPETPEYPFGNSQYASFMTPRDGEPWESKPAAPSNGYASSPSGLMIARRLVYPLF